MHSGLRAQPKLQRRSPREKPQLVVVSDHKIQVGHDERSQLSFVSDHKPHLGQNVSNRKPHLGQKDQHDKRSYCFCQKDHHDERSKLFSVSDHKPHLGQKNHHSERSHSCLLSPITNLTCVGRITMVRITTMREATVVCCLRSQTLF